LQELILAIIILNIFIQLPCPETDLLFLQIFGFCLHEGLIQWSNSQFSNVQSGLWNVSYHFRRIGGH